MPVVKTTRCPRPRRGPGLTDSSSADLRPSSRRRARAVTAGIRSTGRRRSPRRRRTSSEADNLAADQNRPHARRRGIGEGFFLSRASLVSDFAELFDGAGARCRGAARWRERGDFELGDWSLMVHERSPSTIPSAIRQVLKWPLREAFASAISIDSSAAEALAASSVTTMSFGRQSRRTRAKTAGRTEAKPRILSGRASEAEE